MMRQSCFGWTGRFLAPTVLFCLTISSSITFAADLSIKPGDKVIRVEIATQAQLQQLLDWDLDIWSHEIGIGPIDVHVSETELTTIQNAALPYATLNDDLAMSYANEQASQLLRGAGDYTSYKTYAELNAFINNLAATRPDLCSVQVIGQSLEGRNIYVLHITGAGAGPKPGVFYHALQHAREWITAPVVMYLADYLVNNYDTDPCVKALVDRTDFYLSLCVNPDGYEYTWTNTRLWRKNRRNNGGGSFGVDLNRNWGNHWGFDNGGSSPTPNSETYRGTAAFSEPETQVLRNFIISHPNIQGYMDYHSYSQLILWPWGYICQEPPGDDAALFRTVGDRIHDLILAVHNVTYVANPICLGLYSANGSSVDYVYGDQARYAFSIELRDTGENGFILPPEQIIPTCEENLPAILYLSQWTSRPLSLNAPKTYPPAFYTNTNTTVSAEIRNRASTYVAGSGQLHYRIGTSGPFTDVSLTAAGGSLYSAIIPGQLCGTTVQWYFTAGSSSGTTENLPDSCFDGSTLFSAVVTEAPVIKDNFETDLGWTTSQSLGTPDSTGVWQRGIPVNDPNTTSDPITDSDGSGKCYLTQNTLGNSDVDNGSVTLTSPLFNLSTGSLPHTISYDYYLYLSSQNGVDRMAVEVSSNGNSGPWTLVRQYTTSGGNDWRHDDITQANLVSAGVTITSTMKIRFTVNDSNPQGTVEGGLDAFEISTVGCATVPCPNALGDMNADSVINGADIQGFVNAFVNSPYYSSCADLAAPAGTLDSADVNAFVALLVVP